MWTQNGYFKQQDYEFTFSIHTSYTIKIKMQINMFYCEEYIFYCPNKIFYQ